MRARVQMTVSYTAANLALSLSATVTLCLPMPLSPPFFLPLPLPLSFHFSLPSCLGLLLPVDPRFFPLLRVRVCVCLRVRGEAGVFGNALYKAFVAAGEEAGYGATGDYNGHRQEGFGKMAMTVASNGCRASTSTAYLHPASCRSNLTVYTNALAHRVLFDCASHSTSHDGGPSDQSKTKPRATGVVFSSKKRGRRVAAARREVHSLCLLRSPTQHACTCKKDGGKAMGGGVTYLHINLSLFLSLTHTHANTHIDISTQLTHTHTHKHNTRVGDSEQWGYRLTASAANVRRRACRDCAQAGGGVSC